MSGSAKRIMYPVKDLAAAKGFFGTLLGVEPYVDQPYYVGFRVEDAEIGLDPNGHGKGMVGGVGYWDVTDIQVSQRALVEAGGQIVQDVTDVGGGMLITMVKDADGNVVGLAQSPG